MTLVASMPSHDDAVARIHSFGTPVRYRRKQLIWSEGEPADGVVLLGSGSVKLFRQHGERRVTLDLAHRGQLFGTEGASSGTRRNSSAMALSASRGVFVDSTRMRELAAKHPRVMELLLSTQASRAQVFAQDLEDLATLSVEQRLATRLLSISDSIGLPDARGIFIPLRLTRVELSEMAWCRSETVIRLMTRWQEEELVCTQREGIVIRNPQALEKLCQS